MIEKKTIYSLDCPVGINFRKNYQKHVSTFKVVQGPKSIFYFMSCFWRKI